MPIDPTPALDTAAQWGPEIFLAVLILLLGAGFLFVFGKQMFSVIDNNTRALMEVLAMVAKTTDAVDDHEANTRTARDTIRRMDETSKDTNSKVTDMWRGTGS